MLPPYLKSINWSRQIERDQAIILMNQWVDIDLEQALALISGLFSLNEHYTNLSVCQQMNDEVLKKFKEIRHFAVEALKRT